MLAVPLIAWKDLRLLARRRTDAFFVFAFPALFALFFAQVVSGGSGASRIPVAVVDEDGGPAARALVDRLLADEGLRAAPADRAAAETDVRLGRRAAYVLVPTGFGRPGGPALELAHDPARRGEAGLLQGALLRAGFEAAAALARATPATPGAGPAGGAPPGVGPAGSAPPGAGGARPLAIATREVAGARLRAPSPVAVTLPQGLAWALIACAASFGSSLAAERARGTLVRLRAAGLGPAHVLAAKGLACLAAALVVHALLLAVAAVALDLRPGSWGLLALASLSAIACFCGLMVLVAALGRTEEAANRTGWALLLVLAMTGGAMVPSYLVPAWLDALGQASPVRWAILAYEGAIWRGFTPADLAAPCGALGATGAGAFALGAWRFRWS